MTLPPQITAAFGKVDAMSIRERALIAGTVLALVWALWDAVLMQPLNALEQARQEQLASLSTQVADLNRSIQTAAAGRTTDGDVAQRNELASLRNDIAGLERRLGERTSSLIAPAEMARVLEAVLVENTRLEFIGVEALPAEPITASDGVAGFYRHGMVVRLRGNYLDALRYVEALERMNWRFFWDSVEITVDEHPTSDVRITVYTLGEGEGVIGV